MYILYILYDVTNGYATHGYQLKTLIEQESKKQKQKKIQAFQNSENYFKNYFKTASKTQKIILNRLKLIRGY